MSKLAVKIDPNVQMASGQTPKALGLDLQWSKAAAAKIKRIRARYPQDRQQSALIPLLWLAQKEFGGWLSVDAMNLVATTLDLPYIRVYEVATFYTMFNLKPIGQHHIQVCTNCSCMIRGSDKIVQAVQANTGVQSSGETSEDGLFTFTEVECLGACVNAPMMQIGQHYFTDLTPEKTKAILTFLKAGKHPSEWVDTPPAEVDPIHDGKYEGEV